MPGTFANAEVAERGIRSNPRFIRQVMESEFDQTTIDRLEPTFTPAGTDEEKAALLHQFQIDGEAGGLRGEQILVDMKTREDALKA